MSDLRDLAEIICTEAACIAKKADPHSWEAIVTETEEDLVGVFQQGFALAFALRDMADAIRANAPRMCDWCGEGGYREFGRAVLPWSDGVGHEFCSKGCYLDFMTIVIEMKGADP